MSSYIPADLQYSRTHEWVCIEGDVATIGITDFAQRETGEVVFVELPDVGAQFASDDVFGSIESVKAVAELYIPIAGEVIEANAALVDSPELLNEDPYGEGWLIKIRVAPGAGALMSAEAYQEFIASGE